MVNKGIQNPSNQPRINAAGPNLLTAPESSVDNKMAAQKVAAVLTMATQAELHGERKEVMVAGQKIKYPAKAAENFQAAINIIVKYFGDNKISLNEMSFKKFAGNIVGESTTEGIDIDPIMLLHPAARFAHVIAHELSHNKGKIQNEILVESYVRAVLGDTGVEPPEAYKKAVKGFVKFALGFDKRGNAVENTKKIYELYYAGKYEEIYRQYVKGMTPSEEDKALKLFQEVFPELRYSGTGKYRTKPLVKAAKGASKGLPNDLVSQIREIGKKAIKEEVAGHLKK